MRPFDTIEIFVKLSKLKQTLACISIVLNIGDTDYKLDIAPFFYWNFEL